jgi:hypothetical protein
MTSAQRADNAVRSAFVDYLKGSSDKPFYVNDLLYENCDKLIEYALKSEKDYMALLQFTWCVVDLSRFQDSLFDIDNLKALCVDFIQTDSACVDDLVLKTANIMGMNGQRVIKTYKNDFFVDKNLLTTVNIHHFRLFFAFFTGVYGEFKNVVDAFVKVFDTQSATNHQASRINFFSKILNNFYIFTERRSPC